MIYHDTSISYDLTQYLILWSGPEVVAAGQPGCRRRLRGPWRGPVEEVALQFVVVYFDSIADFAYG